MTIKLRANEAGDGSIPPSPVDSVSGFLCFSPTEGV